MARSAVVSRLLNDKTATSERWRVLPYVQAESFGPRPGDTCYYIITMQEELGHADGKSLIDSRGLYAVDRWT